MFNPCRVCGRSQIHDVVYINSHQTVFHYVSHELLDRCRSCTFVCRAGRLSLLLYSPAQDGKHIKCFPLRAELATNLTPAPSPGDPPCRHFVRVVVVPRRFRGSRSPFSSAGLSKVVAEALPLAQRKTGDAICIPRFCCGYSKSINLVLMTWPSFTSILAMVGPRLPLG